MNGDTRGGAEAVSLHALGTGLRAALDRIKREIDAEIAAYPTPIPRCDAQFNHLYGERAALASLLAALDAALARDDDDAAMAAAIADFVNVAAARDDAAANRFRAEIQRVLAPGR